MKNETDTMCREKVNGVACRGVIFTDLSIPKLAEGLGQRWYKCEKCGQRWSSKPEL